MTKKTEQQQKTHLFQKGQSGNPKGRPVGSRHKSTLAALELLEGEASALTRKAIDAALGGDMVALRLCLDRIVAPAKDRPVSISLPEITDASDLPKITGALLAAVAAGEIGPSEAATLAKLVDVHRGALEIADIAERITKLEKEVKK
jgi:hypothetical protein